MLKVALIGEGIERTFLEQYPVKVECFVAVASNGELQGGLGRELLDTWFEQPVRPGLDAGFDGLTQVISQVLQSMNDYEEVGFYLVDIPTYPNEDAMQALTIALQWLAEKVNPDFVHIGFSNQEGRYQKEQNAWLQRLHQQGAKVLCPSGVPPAFPASLEHVLSVADRGFIDAGFDMSNPSLIVEENSVAMFSEGEWLRQQITNETASAYGLSQMIGEKLGKNEAVDNPVILPDLEALEFEPFDLSQFEPEAYKPVKPGFWDKVKSYFKSLMSRLIVPMGKVPASIKRTRKVSCNGDGFKIPPCSFRVPSTKQPRSFVCGACGCGDREGVLVDGNVPKFEKLDYPYVSCPASMPGFSNYLPAKDEDKPNPRKVAIEKKFGREALNKEQGVQARLNQKLEKRMTWIDQF